MALLLMGVCGWAQQLKHTKLTPYGIAFPLIKPGIYTQNPLDAYAATFGVRRVFRSVNQKRFDAVHQEAQNHHKIYGSYGVLGHGEDVFTNAAARIRKKYRGR
jgi:hypothetical protein